MDELQRVMWSDTYPCPFGVEFPSGQISIFTSSLYMAFCCCDLNWLHAGLFLNVQSGLMLLNQHWKYSVTVINPLKDKLTVECTYYWPPLSTQKNKVLINATIWTEFKIIMTSESESILCNFDV